MSERKYPHNPGDPPIRFEVYADPDGSQYWRHAGYTNTPMNMRIDFAARHYPPGTVIEVRLPEKGEEHND